MARVDRLFLAEVDESACRAGAARRYGDRGGQTLWSSSSHGASGRQSGRIGWDQTNPGGRGVNRSGRYRPRGKQWRELGGRPGAARIQWAKISTVCGNARRSVKFLQKPFDSPRGHSYIAPTVGVAALCGGKAIRFSRVSRAYASWPKGWGESGSVFLEAKAFAATIYLLFDNRIGRKRNVDGGVLADRS